MKIEIRHLENKGADQLHSNCAAAQRLCFRYIDNTIHLPPKVVNPEVSFSCNVARMTNRMY